MKRLGVFLGAVLGVFVFASVASAGIMVTAPTFSVPNTSTPGSFTVTVEFSGSYNVAGYDIDLQLAGRSGATGLAFAGASGATTNYVFSLPHSGFGMTTNTASEIYGADSLIFRHRDACRRQEPHHRQLYHRHGDGRGV